MKRILMWTLAGLVAGAVFMGGVLNAAGDEAAQGKQVFDNRCALCHGQNGAGDGPAASSFTPPPADFTKAGFWDRKDIDSIISQTIQNGKGAMPPVPLSSDQVKQVTAYMTQNFKPSGK